MSDTQHQDEERRERARRVEAITEATRQSGERSRTGTRIAGAAAVLALVSGATLGIGAWRSYQAQHAKDEHKQKAAQSDRGRSGSRHSQKTDDGYWWPAHEKEGSVITDASGHHKAKLTGRTSWTSGPHGGAVHLDGAGYGQTDGPVVKTVGKDYSVAAWVRLQDPDQGRFNTALSEDTGQYSAFFLQYSGEDKRFAFSTGASRALAETAGQPKRGRWYHLTGVYLHKHNTLRIYVNGKLAGSARTAARPSRGTGPFVIGRSQVEGKHSDPWRGDLADMHAYPRALSSSQVSSLASGNG